MADATRKGVHLPRRIWNWPRPGPLEVLAGQRTYREPMGHTYESGIGEMDSIEVLLQGSWEIVLEDEITLLIVEEPTL